MVSHSTRVIFDMDTDYLGRRPRCLSPFATAAPECEALIEACVLSVIW